jgi:hypothetical protein
MTNNLVFIKNGGDNDGHHGEIIDYSPIIYDPNEKLLVDDKIKIGCTSWMKPFDCIKKFNTQNKYLICENDIYGYILLDKPDEKIWFDRYKSHFILQELKDLTFERSIFSYY